MNIIINQFASLPIPTASCARKTVVVTGSNVGLGKEAARYFVKLGASKLILAVRSLDKGKDAKTDIETTTSCAKDLIEVWKLDMGSYASVEEFAAQVNKELPRVDIFLANAGVAPGKYTVVEGNESSITINVISTLLLAALVMPKLKQTAKEFHTRPNFTITSSNVHEYAQFPQRSAPDGQILATVSDKATAEKNLDDQYNISKLLEVFAVRALAERHPAPDYPVTINCVNPGLCHSELGRDYDSWGFWLLKTVLARTTEAGSRNLVWAGLAGPESHGQYMSECVVAQPSAMVLSEEGKVLQDRVWKELVEKLDGIKAGVIANF